MSRDSTIIPFRQPDTIDDRLTELAREGARRMLAQALIAEAEPSRCGRRCSMSTSCVIRAAAPRAGQIARPWR